MENESFEAVVIDDRTQPVIVSEEEFLSGAKKPMPLTEENIRRIVREEISNLLDAAGKKADVPVSLEAEKMEDALVTIVRTVSKEEATVIVNDW